MPDDPRTASSRPPLDSAHSTGVSAPPGEPDAPQETVPQLDLPGRGASALQPAHPPGYELQEEIGRGGMGAVYRARDLALDRDVAVKLLGDQFPAGSAAAQRFLDEARITGQLQHPGIPAVHQVGHLLDGRPFLAMKLIRGHTLADELARRPDPTADRGRFVAVFEQLCQAVGYAHAHQVIHRDLKPANVMVGSFGEVQVMDWGLAKVLTERSTRSETPDLETLPATKIRTTRDGYLETQAGSLLGTPAFMPPEQAIGAVDQIDAQSDVFGLGAILCVILTGQPPFVGTDSESTRQLAARGKVEDAFARLDASAAEPELIALAKRCLAPEKPDRPADAGVVAQAVAALRAAAEDRAKRAEVDRARAETELREQRKRRRVLAVAAAVLAAATGVAAWQAVRAKDEANRANLEASNARTAEGKAKEEEGNAKAAAELASRREGEAKDSEADTKAFSTFLVNNVLAATRPKGVEGGIGIDVKMSDALLAAEKDLMFVFAGRPKAEATARHALGVTWASLGKYDRAEKHLQRALELRERELGPVSAEVLDTTNSLAVMYLAMKRYHQAEPLIRRCMEVSERVHGPDHQSTLAAVNNLAMLYKAIGRYDQAEPLLLRALAELEKLNDPVNNDLLSTMNNLATLYEVKGRKEAAESLLKQVLSRREKGFGPKHMDTLFAFNNLGQHYKMSGRIDAAEPLLLFALEGLEEAVGSDHHYTHTCATNVADLYKEQGRYPEAEKQYLRALVGKEKSLGLNNPGTLLAVNNLATMYASLKRFKEAEPLFQRVLAGNEVSLGPDHPQTLTSIQNLAGFYRKWQRYPLAEKFYVQALARMEKALGPEHESTLGCAHFLGIVNFAQSDYGTARQNFLRAYVGREKLLGSGHRDTLQSADNLATVYSETGDYATAEPLKRWTLAVSEKALGPLDRDTLSRVSDLAYLLKRIGKLTEAEQVYKRAIDNWTKARGPDHESTLSSVFGLATLYYDMKRFEEAIPHMQVVYNRYQKQPGETSIQLMNRYYLGLTLFHAGRLIEAEPLLIDAFEGLFKVKTISATNRLRLREVTQGLVQLYDSTSQPTKAAEWRAKLKALPPEIAPRPRPVK